MKLFTYGECKIMHVFCIYLDIYVTYNLHLYKNHVVVKIKKNGKSSDVFIKKMCTTSDYRVVCPPY